MAQITGQAGVNLTSELAAYLQASSGNVTTEQLTNLINQYLTGGDKLAAQGGSITTGIYKRFGEFDQITGKVEVVTTGLWSGDTGSLTSAYTSSVQAVADSSKYYVNVYDTQITSSVQFALAFGQKFGSGSVSLDKDDNSTLASKATYAQYRSLLLEQDSEFFRFSNGAVDGVQVDVESDDIYVINVSRARYKETMDAGNWELSLSGSNGIFTFIDDSGKKFSDSVGKAGRVFFVASGSLNLGQDAEATVETLISNNNGEGYGLFYPDRGMIVLNASAIHDTIGTSKDSGSVGGKDLYLGTDYEGKNHFLLYNAIKGGGDFEARRTENVSTSHYFVRATNREFNFSNNPTFVTGTDGTFAESTFERDPKTFITTVGLYNDANELLAVAKTSQPIAKSYDKEVLIAVKLDF